MMVGQIRNHESIDIDYYLDLRGYDDCPRHERVESAGVAKPTGLVESQFE